MATPLEIVQGISQVVANTHDGALDDKGEPIKIGLKREEGHPILDSRIMDGFGVKISADKLIITYQADIKLKDVHDKSFESDIESMIEEMQYFIIKKMSDDGNKVEVYRENQYPDINLKKIAQPWRIKLTWS